MFDKPTERNLRQDLEAPAVYCNGCALRVSSDVFRLTFVETYADSGREVRVAIVLSHHVAERLAEILQKGVEEAKRWQVVEVVN
jgi:hypothetical protein